jgi:hypothetical protein
VAAAATASIEAAITRSCSVFIAGSMVMTGQQQLKWQWGNDQSINRTAAINQSIAMALRQGHWGKSNRSNRRQWQWGNCNNRSFPLQLIMWMWTCGARQHDRLLFRVF